MNKRRVPTGLSIMKNYHTCANMKYILYLFMVCCFLSCAEASGPGKVNTSGSPDREAEAYVRLGLAIGQYDPDFVDAYYGPDSLKPVAPVNAVFPKDSFLRAVNLLSERLSRYETSKIQDTAAMRAGWLRSQLTAFSRRIKIFSGEYASFDEESRELFGVVAPAYPESYYSDIVKQLDSLLPGTGDIKFRVQQLANRFIIPKDKIDTVFKTAIRVSRERTKQYFRLPSTEQFSIEYVQHKPWSGYNWYKGNFNSLIQLNTDNDIFIERAIDVASHESYPGHHVYNMLLEKNLYRDKGWVEISLYPLFSPQSLIAEGSANYGIELAFPGDDKLWFAKNILLPLAGLDTSGISLYFKVLALKGKLNFARNEVGRGLVNHTMNEGEALRWLTEYGLNNKETAFKSISFIHKYRSYVINYNYGLALVKNYMDEGTKGKDSKDARWRLFEKLLSNEVVPAALLKN